MTIMPDSLLTNAQMAEADRVTIAAGTDGFTLMQRAGAAVAARIRRRYRPQPVLVACGPGNNGGDGYIVAADLHDHGWPVTVAALGNPQDLTGDTKAAFALWGRPTAPLDIDLLDERPILVDALFGAGLDRDIEGYAAMFIDAAAERAGRGTLRSVAIDVPSGVDGDTGLIRGRAIPADLTVTFFRRKPGHLLRPGRDRCGEIRLAPIGIEPDRLVDLDPIARANSPAAWGDHIRPPGADDHKYTRGHVVVLAGAMSGAGRLAARAARRSGAGLVTVICRPGDAATIGADSPGLIVHALDEAARLPELLEGRKVGALVAGPGLGLDAWARDTLDLVLARPEPKVLDADVFSLFAGEAETLIKRLAGTAVFTPHAGEFARLFPDLEVDRIGRLQATQMAAARLNATMLLKGADTVVAGPYTKPMIMPAAPANLATGGSGDVLTGVIAALIGRGVPTSFGAAAGGWIAAEAARRIHGPLSPEALCDGLSNIFDELQSSTDFS